MKISVLLAAVLAGWVLQGAAWAGDPGVKTAALRFRAVELQFKDSPVAEGQVHTATRFCVPSGLSKNDIATGTAAAADGKMQLFVWEKGNMAKIDELPDGYCQQAIITDDGTVAGLIGFKPPNGGETPPQRVVLYRNGKLVDLPLPKMEVQELSKPDAQGDFILRARNTEETLVCSSKTGITKRAPEGLAAGPGFYVGIGNSGTGYYPFVSDYAAGRFGFYKEQSPAYDTKDIRQVMESGDILYGSDRPYVLNALSHKRVAIPLPASSLGVMQDLWIDEHNDAVGNVVSQDGKKVPFVYHDGTSSPLNKLVPKVAAVYFMSSAGMMAGTLENGRLFTYGGKKVEEFEDFRFAINNVAAINAKGQVAGSVKTPEDGLHAFVAAKGVTVDLNDFVAAEDECVLQSVVSMNDNGLILVKGHTKNRAARHAFVERGYLLIPDTTPAGKIAATRPGGK